MHAIISKYLADRGTHLAAMIAYFAILAFVPLLFLALSLLAFAGEQDESSYLIEELERAFPENSVENILDAVTEIGAGDRARSSGASASSGLRLDSSACSSRPSTSSTACRTALHPPEELRPGHHSGIAHHVLALVISSVRVELVQRAGVAEGFLSYLYALLVSTALLLGMTWSLYRLLTNTPLTWRETLPGAIVASILLQASFQVFPVFVRLSNKLIALQAYGGLVLLLVWLYVMANILVLGAEVNWWIGRGRRGDAPATA